MNSVCISSCIKDTRDTRVPVRTTYVNLYKWPESEAEFVRSVKRGGGVPAPRVVDSISCRQMYLRSYTFSREDDDEDDEKSKSEKATSCMGMKRSRSGEKKRVKRKNKRQEQACSVVFKFFRRLLSCGVTVDVVDPN